VFISKAKEPGFLDRAYLKTGFLSDS